MSANVFDSTTLQGGVYNAIAFRDLGDGRGVWLVPMIYTIKLIIGPIGAVWYDDGWCYKTTLRAQRAFDEWNPAVDKEPQGWVRHPPTGRRRFPDGDPATEEVRA
jgi:hypothetical protein